MTGCGVWPSCMHAVATRHFRCGHSIPSSAIRYRSRFRFLSYVADDVLSLVLGEAMQVGPASRGGAALVPQRVGRPQFHHQPGTQRQPGGHPDVDGAAADHRLQRDHRQVCVAQLLHDKRPRRLYILCWSELTRRKLSPTLATPTTLVPTTLVAQCELSRRKIGLLLEVVGRKFSQTWQPCHSWSGKMAGRRRHCRQ